MANLVVINISSAPTRIKGMLQGLMLEIRPGTFVWKLSSKTVKYLWSEITSVNCSAVCIFAARNEAGFVIATHGENKRNVVDNSGVSLIKYSKKVKITNKNKK